MRLLGAALLFVLALEFSPEAKAFKGKNANTIAARSKHKKESVSVPQRKVSPLGSHTEFEPLDDMERKESKMKKKSRERKLHKLEVSTKGKHFVHLEKSKHGGFNATFHEDASGESPDVRSEESSDSIPAMQPPLTPAALGLAPAMQPAANMSQPVPDEEAAEASGSGSGQPAQSPPPPPPPAPAKSQSSVTMPISGPGYKGTTSVKPDGSTESTIVIGPVAPPPAPAFSGQDYLQGVTQRSACAAICPPTCSPQCTPQCCSQQETAPPPRFNPHPPPPRFPERWRERPRYEPGPPVPPPPAVPGRPIKLICAPQCMASPCAPSCPQACCTAPPQVFLPPPPQLPSPIGCQPMCTPTSCVVGCPSHCCARYEPVRHGIADMKHTIPELSKKQLRANETATKSAEGKN